MRRPKGADGDERLRHGDISVHHHVMAETSSHDKQMEDFVGTKIFMSRVKNRKLQRIYDAADGVDNAAGQEPSEGAWCQGPYDLSEGGDANPAHGNVDGGREPFGTVDPQGVDKDSRSRDSPHKGQKAVSIQVSQNDQADGRVGSCNQNENHHMVNFPKKLIDLLRNIEGVIYSTCRVQENHTDNENGKGGHMKPVGMESGFYKERGGGQNSQHHSDKVCQGAAGIFYILFHSYTSSLNEYAR